MFLQVLDHNKTSEFLKKLVKECEASVSVPTKALGKSISVLKIQNLTSNVFTLPVDEVEDLAVHMIDMFCRNLPLSKELNAQDSMYGEELLSMACNVLVQVIEFVQFKERLQRSSQYLMVKIETPILQLKQNLNNIDEAEYNQIKHTEANKLKTIEKRSLLPRMIYLSIYSASVSVKQNIGANGSVVDPKLSVELKILLERYGKILEFPFLDAVELVLGVSSGQKSFEAPNLDIIDWMNFTVFLNAWNLNSHEIMLSERNTLGNGIWHLVNSLLRKYVVEKVKSSGPIVSSPGTDLPFLVQLVTEPLSWHSLNLQSCVRSLLPSRKKKKKGGSIEQSNSQLSYEIQNSIQSLCDTTQIVVKWLKEQIDKSENEKFEAIFSSIRNERSNGPGKVFKILESSVSLMKDVDLGDRILDALHSWNPADVPRKIISGQGSLLSEFLRICELKIKSLQELRFHL